MPPKPSALDGISKPPSGTLSATDETNTDKKEGVKPAKSSEPVPKNEIKSDNSNNIPTTVILITIIVMAILIGLAYFAYTKSK